MRNFMRNLTTGRFSLRRKLIILYLLAAVVPILIITVMISLIYYHSILENAYGLVEQNNLVNRTLIQRQMDSYDDALYEMVVDQNYIDMARQINAGVDGKGLVTENSMKQMFQTSIYTYSDIRSIAFLADNSRCVSYSKWYGSLYDNIWSDARQREAIRTEIESSNELCYLAPVNLRTDTIGTDYVVLIGFPVKNLHTKERYGVFVFALDSSAFMLDYSEGDWKTNSVATVIVDQNDIILAEESKKYIDQTLNDFLKQEFSGERDVTILEQAIEGTQWKIKSIIRRSAYRHEIFAMLSSVIFFIIVITFVFCAIVIYYTNGYIQNIHKIAAGLQSYPGTPEQEIEFALDEKDEMYQIVRQFRSMTVRISNLIEEIEQKNRDIQEATLQRKHAEIKALEAQINPHFLFNTLDSINWRAIENDEEEISNMLGALGSLLRYSVSNIEMVVLMKAEIDWLQKYIFLQRDRFNHSFDCQYEFSDEVLNFPIYKMLLQPIVENTILHAFEDTRSGGMIYFKAAITEDGRLRISIRDNGRGMSPETLEEIRREIREKDSLNSKSIGISNVVNRLWLYYHDKAELYVNSTLGVGSEFIMVIPEAEDRQFAS